jgi:hypothetical protein
LKNKKREIGLQRKGVSGLVFGSGLPKGDHAFYDIRHRHVCRRSAKFHRKDTIYISSPNSQHHLRAVDDLGHPRQITETSPMPPPQYRYPKVEKLLQRNNFRMRFTVGIAHLTTTFSIYEF